MTMEIKTLVLPVGGMSCASCVSHIEKSLLKLEGVESASANLALGNVNIKFQENRVSEEMIIRRIEEAGYSAGRGSAQTELSAGAKDNNTNLVLILMAAFPVFVTGMFFHAWKTGHYISFFLTAFLMVYPARIFFVKAWKQLLRMTPAMDLLVALSAVSAFLYSSAVLWIPGIITGHLWFETPAMILAFVASGKYLEERARQKSSDAIQKLKALIPLHVTVVRNGKEIQVSVSEIRLNDRVRVKAFEPVPVDGTILNGASHFDESAITGEPVPVFRNPGEKVYAGTQNLETPVVLLNTTLPGNTLLDGIVASVANALSVKAPAQVLADRISGVFVPVVVAMALLAASYWWIAHPEGFTFALQVFITLLIIACPCALGLATPTALAAAMGKAAWNGILAKDGRALENLHKTTLVVFDKTGTLTHGKPEVSDSFRTYPFPGLPPEWIQVFRKMESESHHPLAAVMINYLEMQDDGNADFSGEVDVTVSPGRGVTGLYKGLRFIAGNRQMLIDNSIPVTEEWQSIMDKWIQSQLSMVLFAVENQVVLGLALDDPLREEVPGCIETLKKMGLTPWMLTGDHEATASRMAAQAGIDHYLSGLLPGGKKQQIEALKKQGHSVLMVGDGINDAEALAVADSSVAMGKGASLAMDVADITLVQGHLNDLPAALRLSRFTSRVIRQNLAWAFLYNLICLPVAAGILYPWTGSLLSPMIAGAAMSASSILVVTNSLRIRNRDYAFAYRKNKNDL